MKIRRVVTGLAADGSSVVSSDEVLPELEIPGGMKISAVWAYEDKLSLAAPNRLESGYGPGFKGDDMRLNWGVSDLAPGQVLPMHSTRTVDLITVLEGEVTCVLDSGAVITLMAHDVLLQRGAVHAWENRGTTRCVWTFAALGRLDGSAMDARAQEVLDFWFLPKNSPGHGMPREVWFRKDDSFDALIRERFGDLIEQALAGELRDWDREPRGTLARILLLDQFTRNAFRGSASAFAGDELALAAAQGLVESGAERGLLPVERHFAYMPYMHSENLDMQQRCVELFTKLDQETGAFADPLQYAIRHRDIVARFGRFPHRNAILGRAGSAEEDAFLREPGSSF